MLRNLIQRQNPTLGTKIEVDFCWKESLRGRKYSLSTLASAWKLRKTRLSSCLKRKIVRQQLGLNLFSERTSASLRGIRDFGEMKGVSGSSAILWAISSWKRLDEWPKVTPRTSRFETAELTYFLAGVLDSFFRNFVFLEVDRGVGQHQEPELLPRRRPVEFQHIILREVVRISVGDHRRRNRSFPDCGCFHLLKGVSDSIPGIELRELFGELSNRERGRRPDDQDRDQIRRNRRV